MATPHIHLRQNTAKRGTRLSSPPCFPISASLRPTMQPISQASPSGLLSFSRSMPRPLERTRSPASGIDLNPLALPRPLYSAQPAFGYSYPLTTAPSGSPRFCSRPLPTPSPPSSPRDLSGAYPRPLPYSKPSKSFPVGCSLSRSGLPSSLAWIFILLSYLLPACPHPRALASLSLCWGCSFSTY